MFLAGLVVGLIWMGIFSHNWWQIKAVKHGHAEWYIEDNEKEWRWKELPDSGDKVDDQSKN